MRKLVVAGLAALAFLVPSPARAVIFLGARVGYALPSGDMQKGVPLKDNISGNIPIQVDAGLSVLSILSLGVYGSFAPSRIASDLEAACGTETCEGQNLRLGVQLNASPPLVLKSLWGGVFAGLEQQKITRGASDAKFRGWEAGLQGGYDFSVLPFIKIGPYASYSVGRYVTASGAALGSKSQHTALTLGLRGLFDF
jgi:hypothetical protein